LRRRSSATPHEKAFEDGDEMAVFQQPLILFDIMIVAVLRNTDFGAGIGGLGNGS